MEFASRLSNSINRVLTNAFEGVGGAVAKNPWKTIVVALLVSAGLSCKLLFDFESGPGPEVAFVPEGTEAIENRADYIAFFGNEPRFTNVLFVPDDGDVLKKEEFLVAFDFVEAVLALSVSFDGVVYGFGDVCLRVGPNCLVITVFEAWGYNRTAIEEDDDISGTMSTYFSEEALQPLLGGQMFDESNMLESAAAMQTFFYLLSPDDTDFPSGDGGTGDSSVDSPQGALEGEIVKLSMGFSESMEIFPSNSYAFSTEIGGEIQGDVIFQGLSYMLIFSYIVIAFQRKCDSVQSSFALALCGFLCILLSIGAGFGLAMLFGFGFGNSHAFLPFLLLGIGADALFIIISAFRKTEPDSSVEGRMSIALGTAGVSLTVSSLTNVVAFAIGSSTVIPDLSSFCVYASLSFLCLWVLVCTFFIAVVVLDSKRQQPPNARLDVFCCFKSKREAKDLVESFEPSRLSRFISNVYARGIQKSWIKYPFLVVFAGWLAFCAYSLTNLEVEDVVEKFIPDGSYLKDGFRFQSVYFGGADTDVAVVFGEFDYFGKRSEVFGAADKFRFPDTFTSEAPYLRPNFEFWFEEFVADIQANSSELMLLPGEIAADSELGDALFPISKALFLKYLRIWVDSPTNRFSSDVVFEDPLTREGIVRSRFQTAHLPIGKETSSGVFKEDTEEVVATVEKMREICNSFSFDSYPLGFKYTSDWAVYEVIYTELWRNVGLALLSVALITLLLLGNIRASALVMLSVALTVLQVIAILPILGEAIDTVTVVFLVLAVGLSADQSAHVTYAFCIAPGKSKVERAIKALDEVGVAVINSALSTFLAIILQAGSSSYVFRIAFLLFFMTITCSAIGGVLFLPICFGIVGPPAYLGKIKTEAKKASSVVRESGEGALEIS